MLQLRHILSLIIIVLVFTACQKEYSSEDGLGIGISSGTAVFTLNGAPDECTGAEINGTYKANTTLNADNYVLINVNVSNAGTYIITTNTLNGISFAGSGTFTTTGVQTIALKGKGTPPVGGNYSFVPGGADGCSFEVIVEGSSGSVGGTSGFTLKGAPGSCAGVIIEGSYVAGIALGATNKVTVIANVTTIGSYAISTTASNAVSFSASGTFTATGEQPIELIGAGTPVASGDFDFVPGVDGCSFTVTFDPTVTVTNCTTCSYIPTCLGIKYTFQDEGLMGISERQEDILSVKDTTIDGQPYRKVTTNEASAYYNCTSGITTRISYGLTGVVERPVDTVNLTLLKANAALGATWTDVDLDDEGNKITNNSTIAEKGISKVVLGVTFNDVIHVNTKTISSGITTIEYEYYYANGIGLIERDVKDGSGNVLFTSLLKSYFIP